MRPSNSSGLLMYFSHFAGTAEITWTSNECCHLHKFHNMKGLPGLSCSQRQNLAGRRRAPDSSDKTGGSALNTFGDARNSFQLTVRGTRSCEVVATADSGTHRRNFPNTSDSQENRSGDRCRKLPFRLISPRSASNPFLGKIYGPPRPAFSAVTSLIESHKFSVLDSRFTRPTIRKNMNLHAVGGRASCTAVFLVMTVGGVDFLLSWQRLAAWDAHSNIPCRLVIALLRRLNKMPMRSSFFLYSNMFYNSPIISGWQRSLTWGVLALSCTGDFSGSVNW